MHRVHQLAAVIGVLTGIEQTVTPASGSSPQPQYAGAYGARLSWQHPDNQDWEQS